MPRRSIQRCLNWSRCHTQRSFYHSSRQACCSVANLLASPSNEADETQVLGFIRSIRKQKQRAFAAIGDGSSLKPLQALLTPAQAERLTIGSAVRLTGVWKDSPNANIQACELHVKDVVVIGPSDPATFPLQKKYQSPEYLRTMPHLRSRLPFNSLILRLRSQSIAVITEYFSKREFAQTHPPIITSSDCEGAGEVFKIAPDNGSSATDSKSVNGSSEPAEAFFGSPKYLTVSSQLHLEALAQAVGKVWTLSPTFRAEKSDTARHLSEFYMLEAEINFTEDLESVMDLVEDTMRHLVKSLYPTQVGKEIIYGNRTGESGTDVRNTSMAEELERRWTGIIKGRWPRITYSEAIGVLQRSTEPFQHKPIWGNGLQAEHERFIANSVGGGQPVFVTNYPQSIKPFYMLPSDGFVSEGQTVECFDLLVPEVCEIAGGSMREHRLPQLLEAMHRRGMISSSDFSNGMSDESLGGLKWYIDLRRWGSVPHGGFGIGFDRLLGYLAGVPNIREVVAFPRWVGRCDC